MATTECALCESKQIDIRRLQDEVDAQRLENASLRQELVELAKLCTLQQADLARLKAERDRAQPNRPEHVGAAELQLAFEEVVRTYGQAAQNDEAEGATSASTDDADAESAGDTGDDGESGAGEEGASEEAAANAAASQCESRGDDSSKKNKEGGKGGKKKRGGRRPLDMTNLPVELVEVVPPEVQENPSAYRRIADETSDRLAHRPAMYIILRIVRPKYVPIEPESAAVLDLDEVSCGEVMMSDSDTPLTSSQARIVCAELPGAVWPRVMADVSAITQVILSKYDLCLPLHRQERVSPRSGLHLPRSTQCDWIEAAYDHTYRIVDAMMADSLNAHCIATDATGAPVRVRGGSVGWHVFVFIADANHVVFRPARHHDGDTIRSFLGDYRGYLLADAATIYDVLYESGDIVETSCWAHLRRYFWKARVTEPRLAIEALAIIAKLFETGRIAGEIPMPERTEARARLVRPHLELLDAWVETVSPGIDRRTPIHSALTYYRNQYASLRTFLKDGQLRLDNNISEQQLRHLVLGLHNWNLFETPAGLSWYCAFRSLIASCALHGLEPQDYLNEVLRLAPHWSTRDMLALSPLNWARTRAALSPDQQEIITPRWLNSGSRREPDAA